MIDFDNVGLRYGMGPEILRDLTFDVPPAAIVGIIVLRMGPSVQEEEY